MTDFFRIGRHRIGPGQPPFVLLIRRNPLREHRHQPSPARVIGCRPNRAQPPQQFCGFIHYRPPSNDPQTGLHLQPAQGSNRRFAMIAEQLLRLIQQLCFVFGASASMTPRNFFNTSSRVV